MNKVISRDLHHEILEPNQLAERIRKTRKWTTLDRNLILHVGH